MQQSEKKQFTRMIRGLFEMAGKDPSPAVYETWWRIMEKYPMDEISHALDRYATTMTQSFMPVPGGVIASIPSARQISADEAWAHVPKNEQTGAWMTKRMHSALNLAYDLIEAGDMVAARMTFIAAYNNAQADTDWFYSPGWGGNYEDRQEQELLEYQRLRKTGWLPKKEKHERLLIENGSSKTKSESSHSSVTKLRLITKQIVDKQKMIKSAEEQAQTESKYNSFDTDQKNG